MHVPPEQVWPGAQQVAPQWRLVGQQVVRFRQTWSLEQQMEPQARSNGQQTPLTQASVALSQQVALGPVPQQNPPWSAQQVVPMGPHGGVAQQVPPTQNRPGEQQVSPQDVSPVLHTQVPFSQCLTATPVVVLKQQEVPQTDAFGQQTPDTQVWPPSGQQVSQGPPQQSWP